MSHTSARRLAVAVGVTLVVALSACSAGSSTSKVATLNGQGVATTTTISAKDTQDAILAYAACMRENGVAMQDPTFDANGNMTGGGLGRNSGVDRRSTAFQTAQTKCGSLIQGVDFRGGRQGNFDRAAVQTAMNDFTACLRQQGLTVDDITFGQPGQGGNGQPGGNNPGSSIAGGGNGGITIGSGSTVGTGGGGFDGGPNGAPPDGSTPRGPGGAGFDPTARIIERLGLDATDPAVTKAITACQAILTKAFQPTTSTTGA